MFTPDVFQFAPDVFRFAPDVFRFTPDVFRFAPDVFQFTPDVFRLGVWGRWDGGGGLKGGARKVYDVLESFFKEI